MPVAAEGVDPRDVSWEVEDPAYRVYFYGPAGHADEWRVTGARSVNEVFGGRMSVQTGGRTSFTSR